MKCLLAIAARLRKTSRFTAMPEVQDSEIYAQYQEAIADVRLLYERCTLRSSDCSPDEVIALLHCCHCLTFQAFHQADHSWYAHIEGSLSIFELYQNHDFLQLPEAKRLRDTAAHLDISAFAVGKSTRSQEAWLRWQMCPVDLDGRPTDPTEKARGHFDALEITTGYPKSLLTIIAMLAHLVDAQVYDNHSTTSLAKDFGVVESALNGWRSPQVPSTLAPRVTASLIPAWEAMRKSALIFMVRRRGFYSDMTMPLKNEDAARAKRWTHEILFTIEALLSSATVHGVNLGNAMLWPLMVASSECSFDEGLQNLIHELLDGIESYFHIGQINHIRSLLSHFWSMATNAPTGSDVTLENIARALNLSIPIY